MIVPKKSLGQNFLNDKNIIRKIVNLTKISGEKIIEIGPGLGSLTTEIIALKPKILILIEKDFKLYEILKSKFGKYHNIKIINDDILNFNFTNLSEYKIISNLPYNISTKLLLKIMPLNSNLKEIICMIQKEVSEKMNYKNKKMNKYKFICEYCGIYEIKLNISSNVFYPKPRVKSNVIKFTHIKKQIDINKLEFFLNNFFIHKRKKIISNNIFNKDESIKYYHQLRYEDLKFEEVLNIYKGFNFSFN